MTTPRSPAPRVECLRLQGQLADLMAAFVRAASREAGVDRDCLDLADEERLHHEQAGLLIESGPGRCRLAREAEEHALAVIRFVKRRLEEESNRPRPMYVEESRPRRLTWLNQTIREWRRHAPSQDTLLAAFEKDGWPDIIDDPFEDDPEVLAFQRLRDAVRCLNDGLTPGTIRFFTVGYHRVGWRPANEEQGQTTVSPLADAA